MDRMLAVTVNPNETLRGVLAFLALFAAAVAVAHYGPTAVRRLIHRLAVSAGVSPDQNIVAVPSTARARHRCRDILVAPRDPHRHLRPSARRLA